MKSTGTGYDFRRSFERIDEVLNSKDENYTESSNLPSRDSLTFSNGFYAKAAALFVDIRRSSSLPTKYAVPKLAKLYRAFVSEAVAVLDGCDTCDEINIVGDGLWGVFEGATKDQIDVVLETAGKISSLIDVLNAKISAHGYDPLYVGIGLDWGRALIIKTGYLGSGINDVVYVGKVVNSAAKLCAKGQEEIGFGMHRPRVMAGSDFVVNLNSAAYRSFFTYSTELNCYTASVENTLMAQWLRDNA
jgi:class 3 adenylate cyclase